MRYRNEVGGQSKTPNKPPDTAPVFRARELRDRNPATSGGRKTCPNREQSPPCPTSVGPPIVGGMAGRPRSARTSRTSSRQASCLASAAVNVALNLRQCLPQIVPLDKSPPRPVGQTSPGFGPRRPPRWIRSLRTFDPIHPRSTATVGVKLLLLPRQSRAMPGEPARPSG